CIRHAASVRPEPGSNSPLKTNRSWFIERAISSFETDEIKYLMFDFANKISLLTRCSVFKDQYFHSAFLGPDK
ncbi:hypothetical protein Q8I65_24850, partial [Paenibacillus ottowii]|uniref:hypothetical protein n=1 Tax=Paenibacillus ottowii TaxID=2315729 RepID=UPI00273048EE